ncbi:hypothetical protein, partial [Porphyrobacter sp. TH134]|uniref:hypothetical protein n=1 Tax=Porphyrobacter sp. TH134 TaxID=2067450 RepID=UPI001F2B2987
QPLSAKPLHPKRESDFTPNGNPLIPTFATGLFFRKLKTLHPPRGGNKSGGFAVRHAIRASLVLHVS